MLVLHAARRPNLHALDAAPSARGRGETMLVPHTRSPPPSNSVGRTDHVADLQGP